MNEENETCLLDTHTPTAIIDLLKSQEDCTEGLIDLIKTSPHAAINKVKKIFFELDNYDTSALYDLSQSPVRNVRYTATFLVFSKIKNLCKKKSCFEEIEEMYNNVFAVRFRDVDPLIRTMCIQFMTDWAIENKVLRKLDFLKYIGWGLNDRSDSVRKKAVKCFTKLAKVYDQNSNEMKQFFYKHKERIIEMAKYDVSRSVQKETAAAVIHIFNISDVFSEDELLEVLVFDDSVSTEKQKALETICPDRIWNLEQIHSVYERSNAKIFKNFRLNSEDAEAFIVNITEFMKTNSICCDRSSFCFLDILKEIELNVNPEYLKNLLEIAKDNKENMIKIIECLSNVNTFKEYVEQTKTIIDILIRAVENEPLYMEPFANLLKKLEDDFSARVLEAVTVLKHKYTLQLIKRFDITDVLSKSSSSIEKCYGSLWLIINKDYSAISQLEFIDFNHPHELVDFFIFFHKQASDFKENLAEFSNTQIFDSGSATKFIYQKLYNLISENMTFETEEECRLLYRMIELNTFVEHSHMIFRHCQLDIIRFFIESTKNLKPLIFGFFQVVGENKKLYNLSYNLASKLNKNDSDRYIFTLVKNCVDKVHLLDTVLVHFVSALNTNECIVLESMAQKSKFKTACMKKCKSKVQNKSEENITFI